ncbi:MAG: phage tail tape measure protein, partial [Sulfurimonas sp.]|nr:phage tail tape measure protein [Sulfurimonas sp.]
MNDDLLIGIGADLSAFNSALKQAETSFGVMTKRISTTDVIEVGLNLSEFTTSMKNVKLQYDEARAHIINNAIDFGVELDVKELEKNADIYIKLSKEAESEVEANKKATEDKINEYKVAQARKTAIEIANAVDTDKAKLKLAIDNINDYKVVQAKKAAVETANGIDTDKAKLKLAIDNINDYKIAQAKKTALETANVIDTDKAKLKLAIDNINDYKIDQARKTALEVAKTVDTDKAKLKLAIDNINDYKIAQARKTALAVAKAVESDKTRLKRAVDNINAYKIAQAKKAALAVAKTVENNETKRKATETRILAARRKIIKQITDAEIRAGKTITAARMAELNKLENKQLQTAKRVATANAPSSSKTTDKWGGIESIAHAAKTTALYGAMGQVLFGLQNAFRSVGAEVIRFDQSIYSSMAVLNKTKAEGKFLALEVEHLSIAYGTAAEDIQQALLTIGRAGVDSTEQVAAATTVLTQLAKITGDSMSDGAAGLATMLSVYPKLTTEIHLLGEKMGVIANATRLGLKDFTTISNYALTTAKSIGINADSYLALAGAMSKVGLNASTIGTSIRRLKKFTDATSESMTIFFRVLGYSQKDFSSDLIENSSKSLIKFSRALADMEPERFKLMTKGLNIFEKATIDTFKVIGENDYLHLMTSRLARVTEDTKNLSKQAALMATGLSDTFARIGNVIKSAFNETAISALDGMFDRTNAEDYAKAIEELGNAVIFVMKVIVAFGTAIAIVSTAMYVYGLKAKFAKRETVKFNKALRRNLVVLALTVAFSAYLAKIEKTRQEQEKLKNVLAASREEIEAMTEATKAASAETVVSQIAKEEQTIVMLQNRKFAITKEYWGLLTTVSSLTEKDRLANRDLVEKAEQRIVALKKTLSIYNEISGLRGKEGYGDIAPHELTNQELGAQKAAIALNDTINGQINKRYAQYIKLNTARSKEVGIMNKLIGIFGKEGELAIQQEKAATSKLNLKVFELKVIKDLNKAYAKSRELDVARLVANEQITEHAGKMILLKEKETAAQDAYNDAQSKIYQRFGILNDEIKKRVDYQIMATDAQEKENTLSQIQLDKLAEQKAEMGRIVDLSIQAINHGNTLASTYRTVANELASAVRQMALLAGTMGSGEVRTLNQQDNIDTAKEELKLANEAGVALQKKYDLAKGTAQEVAVIQEIENHGALVAQKALRITQENVKMAVLGRTLNNEALNFAKDMTNEEIKRSRLNEKGLTGKAKSVRDAKNAVTDAVKATKDAKTYADGNLNDEAAILAYSQARTAEVAARNKLLDQEARKDPKGPKDTTASDAAKSARLADKMKKDYISMLKEEMELKWAIIDRDEAQTGNLYTQIQQEAKSLKIAERRLKL